MFMLEFVPSAYIVRSKEGGSIGLDACTCSYMSETGVATVNARAHPALKLLGVKASMATARRHMIYVQASNPMLPPSFTQQQDGGVTTGPYKLLRPYAQR
jgi:hypothetical protein